MCEESNEKVKERQAYVEESCLEVARYSDLRFSALMFFTEKPENIL